jgi:hypothetical protein
LLTFAGGGKGASGKGSSGPDEGLGVAGTNVAGLLKTKTETLKLGQVDALNGAIQLPAKDNAKSGGGGGLGGLGGGVGGGGGGDESGGGDDGALPTETEGEDGVHYKLVPVKNKKHSTKKPKKKSSDEE